MTFHTAFTKALKSKGVTVDLLFAELCVQNDGVPPCSYGNLQILKRRPVPNVSLHTALIISKVLGFSLDSLSIHD